MLLNLNIIARKLKFNINLLHNSRRSANSNQEINFP
jgi:hypothetical protein